MYTDEELFETFRNQCTHDKSFIDYIISRYRGAVKGTAMRVLNRVVRWNYTTEDGNIDEFLDFIDGNGFSVRHSLSSERTYYIRPIYYDTEKEEMLPF